MAANDRRQRAWFASFAVAAKARKSAALKPALSGTVIAMPLRSRKIFYYEDHIERAM